MRPRIVGSNHAPKTVVMGFPRVVVELKCLLASLMDPLSGQKVSSSNLTSIELEWMGRLWNSEI